MNKEFFVIGKKGNQEVSITGPLLFSEAVRVKFDKEDQKPHVKFDIIHKSDMK